MPERRNVLIERLTGMDGRTSQLMVRPGRRYGIWIWFDPHEVPEFEGKEARLRSSASRPPAASGG